MTLAATQSLLHRCSTCRSKQVLDMMDASISTC